MKVLLVESDPHPDKHSYVVSDWWGREIEVGPAVRPVAEHRCKPYAVNYVLGPPEFLALLARNNLGRWACAHMIGEILDGR